MDVLEQLGDAYLNGEEGFRFFYNRQTKEVYVPLEEEVEDWEDDDDIELVPVKESREMYEVMVDFSNQFEGDLEQSLFLALNSRKPFRAFKDATVDAGLVEQWYQFEMNYAKQLMKKWLESL